MELLTEADKTELIGGYLRDFTCRDPICELIDSTERTVVARVAALAMEKAGTKPEDGDDDYERGWYRGLTVLAGQLEV